ncbi:MAG: permease prefix domain 1-containing protein [Spirochaetaceae bacterium]|jgi:hypothetical protein|nr:permease prefix domain 1-containing protein [Spirochaetaceae bacterium]
MDANEFVDSLFTRYEETETLADFKEELLGNLNAKIESLVKHGMDESAAFKKASAELGDISALADELSLIKRREVFEERYLDIKSYMTRGRVAAYTAFGVTALFGVTVALITYFATLAQADWHIELVSSLGALIPFITIAAGGFTWLGLTQETASRYPMSGKRAAWYTAAAVLIAFGLIGMPFLYFAAGKEEGPAIGALTAVSMLLPFVLPGGGLITFLVLTEKDLLKPWVKKTRADAIKQEGELWSDPARAARFGLFTGAIWLFAIGIFIALGFAVGFKFSWLVFIFAVALQMLVQGFMQKPAQSGR